MGHKIYLTFIQKQSDQYNHHIVPGTQITRNTSTGDPAPRSVTGGERQAIFLWGREIFLGVIVLIFLPPSSHGTPRAVVVIIVGYKWCWHVMWGGEVWRVELSTNLRQSCTITEKAPTSSFTFKNLLRNYAQQAPKHSEKTWNWDADNQWVALRIYANQTICLLWPLN